MRNPKLGTNGVRPLSRSREARAAGTRAEAGLEGARARGRVHAAAVVADQQLHARELTGKLQALWIVGCNPLATRPNSNQIRRALERARLLVVQDVCHPTETSLYEHVLLPAWVSAYRYRDKVYRFVVNGQNGRTTGESPL